MKVKNMRFFFFLHDWHGFGNMMLDMGRDEEEDAWQEDLALFHLSSCFRHDRRA